MKNYLFINNFSGEEFFVQEESYSMAQAIAIENFGEEIEFIDVYSDEEAEILGYDTY